VNTGVGVLRLYGAVHPSANRDWKQTKSFMLRNGAGFAPHYSSGSTASGAARIPA